MKTICRGCFTQTKLTPFWWDWASNERKAFCEYCKSETVCKDLNLYALADIEGMMLDIQNETIKVTKPI